MQIFINYNGTHTVECSDDTSVGALKRIAECTCGIAAKDQVLYYNGHILEDDELVSQYLQHGSTVVLKTQLLGGKVHGSLARAGKVRAQTPKVEKQEKKKKPTGRAKRRLQYNRRFVSAVRVPGRRRGPNANA